MGNIQLIQGDCLEELPLLDDGIADLVVLDPNYNDWDELCKQGIICQAVRLLKNTGNLICFTKQPFDFNLRNEINHIFRREIVWSFNNGGAWVSNQMPLVSFQKIYWCTPFKKSFYFNQRTGMPYNDGTPERAKRKNKVFGGYCREGHEFVKSENGIWIRDHLHFNKPQMGKIPAKPQELIDILVRCFSPNGGLVVDPFMGSATTGVACVNTNRNFIGIELNEEYFKIAENRIKDVTQQLTLF